MTERIRRLAESGKTADIYPVPRHVEYDMADLALPDPVMNAKRLSEYMLAQEVQITDDTRLVGRIKFDNTVVGDIFTRRGYPHFRAFADHYYSPEHIIDGLAILESQHSVANYRPLLAKGILGLKDDITESIKRHAADQSKADYLNALLITCDGILAWADKCGAACEELARNAATPERKKELSVMAGTIRYVPRNPARSFREAVQCLYFCWHFCPDSTGLIDRFLYPYYISDIRSGVLSRAEAKELLQELFITINHWTDPTWKHAADKGGESHFAIGGYTVNGEDGYNELSALIVESIMELPLYRPQISLRWTDKTPASVLEYILSCEHTDPYKRIAIVNDIPRVRAYQEIAGLPYETAVQYTMLGCNECALPGTICDGGLTSNFAKSIERTLYDSRDQLISCVSFDDFYKVFEQNLKQVLGKIVEYHQFYDRGRSKDHDVLSSLFFDGPVDTGKSLTQGGGKYCLPIFEATGLICVIDSLTVIDQFVYSTHKITMEELLDALEHNWEGYEELYALIKRKAEFFGNNSSRSDGIARRLSRSVADIMSGFRSLFGGKFLIGNIIGYRPHNVWYGKVTKATPDGRLNGDAFMIGIGQSEGKDREGLTALLNSVAQMDPPGIFCGPSVFNVTIDDVFYSDEKRFSLLVSAIEAFFKAGGVQIQLNSVSRETLLDAQKDPDHYQNLRVRVSGFSVYFVGLDVGIQNEIIRRTQISR